MAIALDPREGGADEQSYILTSDQDLPEEDQTTWYIRPLTEGEWARVMDLAMDEDTGIASIAMETLRYGLIRCENFCDSSGAEQSIQRFKNRVTDNFLSKMDWAWRIEIADQIQRLSRPAEADVEKPAP